MILYAKVTRSAFLTLWITGYFFLLRRREFEVTILIEFNKLIRTEKAGRVQLLKSFKFACNLIQ